MTRRAGLAIVLLVVIGALLEASLGQDFIFAGSKCYAEVRPWLFVCLLPLAGFALLKGERQSRWLQSRYPTAWVRWGLIYPLSSLATVGVVLLAPLGWAALLGYALGEATSTTAVTVRALGDPSPRSSNCRQHAVLAHGDSEARICLDGRRSNVLAAEPPRVGERLRVQGWQSGFGLYIGMLDRPGAAGDTD